MASNRSLKPAIKKLLAASGYEAEFVYHVSLFALFSLPLLLCGGCKQGAGEATETQGAAPVEVAVEATASESVVPGEPSIKTPLEPPVAALVSPVESASAAPVAPPMPGDRRAQFSQVFPGIQSVVRGSVYSSMEYQADYKLRAKPVDLKWVPLPELAPAVELEQSGATNEAIAAFAILESSSKLYLVKCYAQARVAVLHELSGNYDEAVAAYTTFLTDYATIYEHTGWVLSRLVELGEQHGAISVEDCEALLERQKVDMKSLQPYAVRALRDWRVKARAAATGASSE